VNRFGSFSRPLTWFAALLLAALVAGCGSDQTTGGNALSAATAPALGTEQSFAVLGGSTVTNTGSSVITGNVGASPGTVVGGFPPGFVTPPAVIHAADGVALQAQTDTTTTYNNLAGQVCDVPISADLAGSTLAPGVYCSASSMGLTGALTLDAGGDPDAVWVFQMGETLTTASDSSVVLINGADPCNVFWQVGSSATLGSKTLFVGNIFALTSITLITEAEVFGRVLARNGAVTLDDNVVTKPTCNVPPTSTRPTLSKSFSLGTINAGGVSTLTITLSNANNTPANLSGPLIDNLPPGLMVVPGSVKTTCIETKLASGWFIDVPGKVGLTAEGLIPANGSCTVTADVTAAAAGTYVNSLPAGALQTDHGNNTDPADATLIVN